MKQTIKLDDGTAVEITKLPIGKYAELLRALKQLPKKLGSFAVIDVTSIISDLPAIIADSLDDFVEIVSIATPLSKDIVSKLGLAEMVDLVIAVFEVNDYGRVIEKIKKVTAQPAQNEPTTK